MIQRRISDPVDSDDGVERAALALMGELDAVNVVRRGVERFGARNNFRRRHIKEFGPGIDEALDQPRAGDAVDLRTLARDPCARVIVPLASKRRYRLRDRSRLFRVRAMHRQWTG